MRGNQEFNKFIYTLKVVLLTTTVIALSGFFVWQFSPSLTQAQEAKSNNMNQSERKQKGIQVINELSGGAGQPALESLQKDFPFLADATLEYSLGDVWSRKVLDPKTRQLAAISAFAAQGTLPQMKIHAVYALNLGVTRDELKEIIYLTTVHAGFPRALNAATALKEVFDEQDKKAVQKK
jgi:4-carboxymuconolactone decarboxylase